MLEAIACGKPVVTHLWLESCGQANCFIDEKNYILRDGKKEKEFGFSMPASLACACRYALLKVYCFFRVVWLDSFIDYAFHSHKLNLDRVGEYWSPQTQSPARK